MTLHGKEHHRYSIINLGRQYDRSCTNKKKKKKINIKGRKRKKKKRGEKKIEKENKRKKGEINFETRRLRRTARAEPSGVNGSAIARWGGSADRSIERFESQRTVKNARATAAQVSENAYEVVRKPTITGLYRINLVSSRVPSVLHRCLSNVFLSFSVSLTGRCCQSDPLETRVCPQENVSSKCESCHVADPTNNLWTNQPASQSANQPVNQSVSQSVRERTEYLARQV